MHPLSRLLLIAVALLVAFGLGTMIGSRTRSASPGLTSIKLPAAEGDLSEDRMSGSGGGRSTTRGGSNDDARDDDEERDREPREPRVEAARRDDDDSADGEYDTDDDGTRADSSGGRRAPGRSGAGGADAVSVAGGPSGDGSDDGGT